MRRKINNIFQKYEAYRLIKLTITTILLTTLSELHQRDPRNFSRRGPLDRSIRIIYIKHQSRRKKKKKKEASSLTGLEDLQVEVAAAAVADAADVVHAGPAVVVLHGPRGAPLELLQEAVDLVLDARRRAGHFSGPTVAARPSTRGPAFHLYTHAHTPTDTRAPSSTISVTNGTARLYLADRQGARDTHPRSGTTQPTASHCPIYALATLCSSLSLICGRRAFYELARCAVGEELTRRRSSCPEAFAAGTARVLSTFRIRHVLIDCDPASELSFVSHEGGSRKLIIYGVHEALRRTHAECSRAEFTEHIPG